MNIGIIMVGLLLSSAIIASEDNLLGCSSTTPLLLMKGMPSAKHTKKDVVGHYDYVPLMQEESEDNENKSLSYVMQSNILPLHNSTQPITTQLLWNIMQKASKNFFIRYV